MAKWNKKIGLAVLNLGLLVLTPSMANAADCYSCDPCDPCADPCGNSDSCFGGYDLGVDFLYWKAAIDDLDWCVKTRFTNNSGNQVLAAKYHDICPGWEPGVRVRLSKDDCWCDWRIGASYTRVKSTADRTCDNHSRCEPTDINISSPLLVGGMNAQYEYAKAKWDSTYQTWDLLFSYDIDCNRCHVFSPFFGLEGLILNQSLEADYYTTCEVIQQNHDEFKWTSNYFGVGIKVGSDYTYNIYDCLKLFARASGTLVIGDDDSTNTQTFYRGETVPTYERLRVRDDSCARIVPGYHVQLGLLYESCYCGTEWGFRLGWEFVNWCNIANHRVFANSDDSVSESIDDFGSTSPNVRNYGFHGLLAGLELHF